MNKLNSLLGIVKFLASSNDEKINIIRKGITECGVVNTVQFMQGTFGINTILSGSIQSVRNMVIMAHVKCALSQKFPVIILHSGNSALEDEIIASNIKCSCEIVNNASMNFSPFIGLNKYETVDVIIDAIPPKYGLNQNAHYYLEAIADLMVANHISCSFQNYVHCPHDTLLTRVDNAFYAGRLTATDAESIRSKIMLGQSESFKIDSFLQTLQKQMGRAVLDKQTRKQPVSLYKTIMEKGMVAINIDSMLNSMYLDFLIEQIKIAMHKCLQFMLIFDSIHLSRSEKIRELLIGWNNNIPFLVSCDDMASSCGGNQELLNTMIGTAKQLFIFSHSSAVSANYWSNIIGEYERIDESISRTQDARESIFAPPTSYYPDQYRINKTVSTFKRRDFIIPPEKIVTMQNNEFYQKSVLFRGTRHGYITSL